MRPIPMVRVNALVPFVSFLEGIGAPVERLLQDAGILPMIVANPEQLLPLHQLLAFLDRAASSEGLEDLGLIVGAQTRFDALGTFARLVDGAPTVGAALLRLIEAIPLHNSGDRVRLDVRGDKMVLAHTFTVGEVPGRHQGEQFSLMVMIAAVRALVGPDWLPDAVSLPAGRAYSRQHVESALQRPVFCGGVGSAIVAPGDLLSRCMPVHGAPPDGAGAAWRFLRETGPAAEFVGSLRQVVAGQLEGGRPSIRRTADAIGLSPRTLQRRLGECDECYSGVVEAVRIDKATHLLRQSEDKVVAIAGELGYGDHANFTRAFRRWTGTSPSTFRRQRG